MNKIIVLLFLVLLTAGTQAVAAQSSNQPGRSDDKDAAAIKKELTATAEGWNNGDLKKYLAAYVPGAKEMTSEARWAASNTSSKR